MIFCCTPFRTDMNLGRAYNEVMERLAPDDWACFLDHDACWTTPHWHQQIADAIAAQPNAGLFTAVTNRIASRWQQASETLQLGDDIAAHRRAGQIRTANRQLLDVTDTQGIGGVVMVINKQAWGRVDGGFVDGLFCVDHNMHFAQRRLGSRVWLIEGLYVYHWRGSSRDPKVIRSAPKAECPCRTLRFPEPTVRVYA